MTCVTNSMRLALQDHQLEIVQDGKVTVYYLKKPGDGRMMSTMLIFSPEGIVLIGDLTPQMNGSISSYGYGIDWFASRLSEDYLCEKFLHKQWQVALAKETMQSDWWQDDLTPQQKEGVEEIIHWMEDHGWEWLYNELLDLGIVCDDGVPGYGYVPHEAGWLCAIQQKFVELYGRNSYHLPKEQANES
jgi:hypothetical protein